MESTSTFRCLTEKWLMYRCKQAVVNTNYFTDSWVQNTVECRYNAVQYSEILHKWLQELRQIIDQMLNKQTTHELWGVFCWYCWENRPRYNGTALYLIVDIGCNYKTNGDQRVSSTQGMVSAYAIMIYAHTVSDAHDYFYWIGNNWFFLNANCAVSKYLCISNLFCEYTRYVFTRHTG